MNTVEFLQVCGGHKCQSGCHLDISLTWTSVSAGHKFDVDIIVTVGVTWICLMWTSVSPGHKFDVDIVSPSVAPGCKFEVDISVTVSVIWTLVRRGHKCQCHLDISLMKA